MHAHRAPPRSLRCPGTDSSPSIAPRLPHEPCARPCRVGRRAVLESLPGPPSPSAPRSPAPPPQPLLPELLLLRLRVRANLGALLLEAERPGEALRHLEAAEEEVGGLRSAWGLGRRVQHGPGEALDPAWSYFSPWFHHVSLRPPALPLPLASLGGGAVVLRPAPRPARPALQPGLQQRQGARGGGAAGGGGGGVW